MIHNIIKDKPTRLFLILGGFFIANALIAEIIGAKLFSLEKSLGIPPADLEFFGNKYSFNLTAGVVLWPVVFIMTDIINEYFGPRGVRFLSFLAVILIAYSFLMFGAAIGLAPADFWARDYFEGVPDSDKAFKGIFGQSQSIIIASLIAFFVSQILDVFIFHKIKEVTGEDKIWLRATASTLVSQLIDSFLVLFIAFYVVPQGKPWPFSQVMATCLGNYIYKFFIAIAMTPVIYLVHAWIERYLGKGLAGEMKLAAMRRA